jgi:hypothetical protein
MLKLTPRFVRYVLSLALGAVMMLGGSVPAFTADSLSPASTPENFRSSGYFARIDWSEFKDGTFTHVFVYVTRATQDATSETWLTYYTTTCGGDPWTCSERYGSGQIPNTDIHFMGDNRASLNTDTSTNPNFSSYPVGGVIALDWQSDGLVRIRSNGTSSFSVGTFLMHTSGQSDQRSASAQGSLLGTPVSVTSNEASLGRNAGNQLSIERGN